MAEKTLANPAKKWAREYETIYILRPSVEPEGAAKVADRITEVMEKGGAKIIKVETWGVRRLAYTIAKHRRGIFVYVRYAAYGDVPAELERNLRLLEPVIRYQTIVLTERTDMDAVEVNADDAQFEAIEKVEVEEELSTAQQLGMEERKPREEVVETAETAEAAEATEEASETEEAPAEESAEGADAAEATPSSEEE